MFAPELARHDRGQGRLAQAGRTVEQDVVGRVPSLAGGPEQDREIGLELALADVLVQRPRPQRPIDDDVSLFLDVRRQDAREVSHGRARSCRGSYQTERVFYLPNGSECESVRRWTARASLYPLTSVRRAALTRSSRPGPTEVSRSASREAWRASPAE